MKNNKVSRNPGMAIGSLVLAFLIWFVINNMTNPVIVRTFSDVPVTTINAAYLESMGLSYSISNTYNTTSVTVRGNRSDVEAMSASGFVVTADLRQIIDMESDPVMVPLSVAVNRGNYESISLNPQSIPVQLEEMKSKDFVITPSDGGTMPANAYELGRMEVSPEKMTIRGPASMIDIIDRVVAYVDISNLTDDRSMKPTIRIYDRNGNEFTEAQLSSLSFNVDVEEMRVQVTLHRVVSGVEIAVETYGMPAFGYRVGDITVTPDTVSVVGSAEALAALAQAGNKIVIPADSRLADVTNATSDIELTPDIEDYLPEGIRLAQDTSSTIVLFVSILPYNSISLSFDTKNIAPSGLAEDLNCVFSLSQIEIKVQGEDAQLEKLKAENVEVRVDLSDAEEGQMEVPLEVILPGGLTLVEDVKAEITITKTETTEPTGASTQSAESAVSP